MKELSSEIVKMNYTKQRRKIAENFMHAMLVAGWAKCYHSYELARKAFDYAEAFIEEAKSRESVKGGKI